MRPYKYEKIRYAIRNVSKKDLSKINWEFEKLPYNIYERKRHKHDPTDNCFDLEIQLVECMMRVDALNSNIYPIRTEMTALSSHVF